MKQRFRTPITKPACEGTLLRHSILHVRMDGSARASGLLETNRASHSIEMIMTAVILAIIAVPISGVLLAAAAESSVARERTAADQLVQAKLEAIRTLSYAQVGITGGNPPGTLTASISAGLPNGSGSRSRRR